MSQGPENIVRDVFSPAPANTEWEWEGAVYRFSALKASDSEKMEAALVRLRDTENKSPKDGKNSDFIRHFCLMIGGFFADIFGEDASNAIMGDGDDLDLAQRAYISFLGFANEQKSVTSAMVDAKDMLMNRAQRRAQARAQKGKVGAGGIVSIANKGTESVGGDEGQ